jgi:DNA ligase D-like protein (predicted ligase)
MLVVLTMGRAHRRIPYWMFKMPALKAFPFEPMLCESAERPPEGRDWRYELKLDGFRAIGRKSGRSAQLWSRNQKDFSRRFPGVVKAIASLPSDIVIDGEIVALERSGTPSFSLLQGIGSATIVMYAFDLLMWQGKDVRSWPLEKRRQQLRKVVQRLPDTIRFSETFDVPLSELVRAVRQHQLEGIVAKRACSQYRPGVRCGDWVKWRANRGQEFVIGGYVPNGTAVDSILVGYYIGRDLLYASAVRAGISKEFRRALLPHFEKLQTAQCPFANLPERTERRWGEGLTAAKMGLCRWLDPFLVARIELLEWTPENRLRHSRFAGIRSDKDASDVVREGDGCNRRSAPRQLLR